MIPLIGALLVFLNSFFSCIIYAISGFGNAILYHIIWNLLGIGFPQWCDGSVVTATVHLAVLSPAMALSQLIMLWRAASIKLFLAVLVTCFPTTIVFTMLLKKWSNEADVLKAVLGVILLVVGLWQFVNEFWSFPTSTCDDTKTVMTRKTLLGAAVAGIASGAMIGLFSIGGPPMMVWVLLAEPDPTTWRGTSALIFTVNNVGRLPTVVTSGLMEDIDGLLISSIVVGSILGVLAGNGLADKISVTFFRRAVIFTLLASSIFMLHTVLRIISSAVCFVTTVILLARRFVSFRNDVEATEDEIALPVEVIGKPIEDSEDTNESLPESLRE